MNDIIRIIDNEIGGDISGLKNAKEFYERLCVTKQELDRKLYRSNEVNDGIGQLVQASEETIELTETVRIQLNSLKSELITFKESSDNIRKQLEPKTRQIDDLKKLQCYFEWLLALETISCELEEDLKQSKRQSAVFDFQRLLEIVVHLQSTKCVNLNRYVNELSIYWYDLLQERLESEFDKTLEILRWPIISSSDQIQPIITHETISKFETVFGLLLQLQLPESIVLPIKKESEELTDQLLPLAIMFRHFQRRFAFHFMKSRKTNRLDKPEWYFTQILTWIKDNVGFVEKYVQPLLDESKIGKLPARVELMRSLVHLSCWKLKIDLRSIIYDDQLMTHCIDEVLLFEKELQSEGYVNCQPSIINVLTEESAFTKWLTLELKFSEERMDLIFISDCAWKYRYSVSEELDDLKVPEFAEAFMTMLLLMTERYRLLPESKHQIEFLSLQLKLLDDFRLRLQQLRNAESTDPLKSHFPHILNAVNYVILVLKEWSNLPFYLQLYYTKQCLASFSNSKESLEITESLEEDDSSSVSVFHPAILLFEHMRRELLKTIESWILCDVKAKSRPYRKEKWFSIVASEISDLTIGAYPMLKVLKDHLHKSQEILSESLFTIILHRIATELSLYIYEEVILQNLFSEGGAAQLQQDINRNINPIFAAFMKRPGNYFKEVKEACTILSMAKGLALLLKEVLVNPGKGAIEALEEQGIFKLSPSQAQEVLVRRTDMV